MAGCEVHSTWVSARPGGRVGGGDWGFNLIEVRGSQPGPCTAFVAGVYGDKPLGGLILLRLTELLAQSALRGSALIIPAANLPAIEAGTRISPDLLLMNRRFPGNPEGTVTDQLAYHVFKSVRERTDCVVDFHAGMPAVAVWYTYEYGDIALASAFGLPVVSGHAKEGQLSTAIAASGATAILPEFSGGPLTDFGPGLTGCLNILKHRGQLPGELDGPPSVQVIERLQIFFPSVGGVLCSSVTPSRLGEPVAPGRLAWVVDPSDGHVVDEFVVEESGAVLLLSTITPLPARAGDMACMVGFPAREVPLGGS
jgi:predicted deacylase